jgi:hypothetical protein
MNEPNNQIPGFTPISEYVEKSAAIPRRSDLLRRARNLLSHPSSWWDRSAECRSNLIGEMDADLQNNKPDPEVTIGRLRKRIVKLMDQRDGYKKQLEHYKVVVGSDWRIEQRYNRFQEVKSEHQRVRALETRVKEQEELIKLLRKENERTN